MSNYIQVGVTAIRDPKTGEILHSVPMYARAKDLGVSDEKDAVDPMASGISATLADMFKQYVNGCREAGLPI